MSETLSPRRNTERFDDAGEHDPELGQKFYRVLGEAGVTDTVRPFGLDSDLAMEHPAPNEMPDTEAYQTGTMNTYEKGIPID